MEEKRKPILSVKSAINYAVGIMGVQLLIGYINGYQSQFYSQYVRSGSDDRCGYHSRIKAC